MPYLDVPGTTLYYEDDGAGRQPLLFLHGWGTGARVWGAQLPEFVRHHRVVALDWRGCGRSGRPAKGWVVNWFAPGTSPSLVDWTVRQILDSGTYIDEHFTAFASYDPRPRLADLRVPIHYIHGALDTQPPVGVARTCAALTPGAGVSVIEGAGHLPHQERPAEFNVALRAALADMVGRPNDSDLPTRPALRVW